MFKFTHRLPNGVRGIFRLPSSRIRLLEDMNDEMRFHVEMRVAELRAAGLDERDAEAEALRRFGDPAEFREYAARRSARLNRRQRIVAWMHQGVQDARYAVRQFRRNPAFAALAVLTVALGIGANTAMFSIVHHVLLDPLPFDDGNRIVVFGTGPEREIDRRFQFQFNVPASAIRRLEAQSRAVTEVSEVADGDAVLDADAHADTVNGAAISVSFLPMLRVHVAIGRAFNDGDTRLDSPPVALIAYGVWQQRFGGDRSALGKIITVNGLARTIVGVTPPDLNIPILSRGRPPDVWTPLALDATGGVPLVFARLTAGATSASAARELQSFLAQAPEFVTYKGLQVYASTALDSVDPGARRAIEILFVTVCGLLLIACANLANLLFMRGWTRQRELAVRRALGAGRARLMRQLLTESLALSLLGGGAGLLVAWVGLRLSHGSEYTAGAHIDRAVMAGR
ncbi:MAG TPA: ABC transporter permease [Gemmatimonadaceae bacterium]|nr:ABC transporter permease [Gemmatimonadaceae bacterium]